MQLLKFIYVHFAFISLNCLFWYNVFSASITSVFAVTISDRGALSRFLRFLGWDGEGGCGGKTDSVRRTLIVDKVQSTDSESHDCPEGGPTPAIEGADKLPRGLCTAYKF